MFNHKKQKSNKLLDKKRMLLDVQFFIRKSKSEGYCSIYCHISVNRKRTKSPFSTGIKIPVECWDKKRKEIIGEKFEIESSELTRIKQSIYQLFTLLENSSKSFTADYLKDIFINGTSINREIDFKVKDAIDLHFESYKLNKTKTVGTKVRVKQYANRAKECLGEVKLTKFEEYHIDNFYHFLTNKYNNSHNVAVRAVEFLQKAIEVAHKKGFISAVPCYGYKIKRIRTKKKAYLTKEELYMLEKTKFLNKNLERVRDIFVFCCYTGLDYGDSNAFRANWVQKDSEGEHLDYKRAKTSFNGVVPFFPEAKAIAEKYGYDLPVGANQYHNRMIKEACYLAGINPEKAKKISTHSARVTAGMVWRNKGISLDTIKRMLGHASVTTTEKYYSEPDIETILREARNVG